MNTTNSKEPSQKLPDAAANASQPSNTTSTEPEVILIPQALVGNFTEHRHHRVTESGSTTIGWWFTQAELPVKVGDEVIFRTPREDFHAIVTAHCKPMTTGHVTALIGHVHQRDMLVGWWLIVYQDKSKEPTWAGDPEPLKDFDELQKKQEAMWDSSAPGSYQSMSERLEEATHFTFDFEGKLQSDAPEPLQITLWHEQRFHRAEMWAIGAFILAVISILLTLLGVTWR